MGIFIGNAISLNKLHNSYEDKGSALSNQVNNFDRSRIFDSLSNSAVPEMSDRNDQTESMKWECEDDTCMPFF